ncbi:hypothetical protein [Amycolatopsis kentuckyensis]|uniref:hypothetical protein n=1 Tax=Amycolatopsis kentuckyensis TaxID=218823 RepID=UPI00356428BF
MPDEINRLEAELMRLSQYKLLSTSEPLEPFPQDFLPESIDNLATFKALVSQVYMQWHEKWGVDVGFLLGTAHQVAPLARTFWATLKDIRTAHQHSTNKPAVRALSEWQYEACGARSPTKPNEWALCAEKLIAQLVDALSDLADVAMIVQQRESDRRAWRQRSAESVRSAVVRVAADLGLQLSAGSIDYYKRQVEGRWRTYRIPRGKTIRSELDSLVERSLMAQSPRLPCGHLEILQELGVIGSSAAFAGIQLAHAVAAVSRTRGDAFLKLVVATWASVQPSGFKPASK